ncbi:hypothetical protein HWV62_35304 [Athelia sp. TMB]|nr:hypothetical protein HWV62_35304 [Athelia sp. TMB]
MNVSWTGPTTMTLWSTTTADKAIWSLAANLIPNITGPDNTVPDNPGPTNFTIPVVLTPFKNYTITLTAVGYTFERFSWFSLEPTIIAEVDSGTDSTLAMFASAPQPQNLITHRTVGLTSPSALVAGADVLANIGGIFAFVDGIFSLIFGRTVMAILFGSRAISPFGILGIVTRNRFKRLIHEQYPAMQEDIENSGRLGMAAYISEVAIDAALIDESPASSSRSSLHSSRGDDESCGETIGMGHMQTISSSNYLTLLYETEELDLGSHIRGP